MSMIDEALARAERAMLFALLAAAFCLGAVAATVAMVVLS